MLPPGQRFFDRQWLVLVLVVFVVEIAFFTVVSATPLTAGQSDSILNGTQGILTEIENEPLALKAIDIFLNNAGIAVFEFIPITGWIKFYSVTLATGQVISALAASSGIPAPLLLITTFLSPHSWIELSAYAVAVAESLLLVYAIPKRRFRAELNRAVASVVLAMMLLFFAAFLEAITVQYDLIGFVYAWMVAVFVGLAIYAAWRRGRRHQTPPSGAEPTSPSGVTVPSPQGGETGGASGSAYMESSALDAGAI